MLAGTVDAGKRLFVQQADHAVARGHLLHDLHRQLVLVGSDVAGREHRRELVLRGRHFVVLRLGVHAELPELLVQILHERRNARLDAAEVMIVQLLAFRRLGAEERAAGVDQILALVIHGFVDQEVLLLGADGRAHGGHVLVAEQVDHTQGLTVERLGAAQQRRLFIERLAAVRAERRRNAQHIIFNECIGRRVPSGVAARLKRCAQAAGREAGRIRLAADELLAGKLHRDLAAGNGADEAVVLLGRHAVEWLEPVREMRRTMLERPLLHAGGDLIGDLQRQRLVLLEALPPRGDSLGCDILLHRSLIEDHTAENLRNIVGFTHHGIPLLS